MLRNFQETNPYYWYLIMTFEEQFENIEIENLNLVRLPNISFTKEEMGQFAEKSADNEQFLQQ